MHSHEALHWLIVYLAPQHIILQLCMKQGLEAYLFICSPPPITIIYAIIYAKNPMDGKLTQLRRRTAQTTYDILHMTSYMQQIGAQSLDYTTS